MAENRKNENNNKADAVKEVLSFLLYIAIVLILTYLVIHFVGQRTEVSGSSMENTSSGGNSSG